VADEGRLFPPTTRRRARAREAGVLAHSPLLSQAAGALAGGAVLALTGPHAATELCGLMRESLRSAGSGVARDSSPVAHELLMRGLITVAALVAPAALAAAGASALAHLWQTGWWVSWPGRGRARRDLALRTVRLPRAGWSVARGLLAGAGGAAVVYVLWRFALAQPWGADQPTAAIGFLWLRTAVLAVAVAAAVLLALAWADLAIQRALFERQLQMTWWEKAQDLRDTERRATQRTGLKSRATRPVEEERLGC